MTGRGWQRPRYRSRGLGALIIKQLARQFGGNQPRYETRPGGGTSVTVDSPKARRTTSRPGNRREPRPFIVDIPNLQSAMHFIGVFNKDGGTFRTMDMAAFTANAEKIFAEHGHSLELRIVEGSELEAELERAATAADVFAGGGDGTISAAAGICFSHEMALAVLPARTMNLFARTLGVPLQLDEAVAAIAAGEVGAVDIATANGRPSCTSSR